MASKKKAPLTWTEKSQLTLDTYLKKSRSKQGSLLVLGSYGDCLVQSGRKPSVDTTTLGSLAASVAAAGESLGSFLKLSGEPIQFGTDKASFWFSRVNADYLLVGIRCPLHAGMLKTTQRDLKKILQKRPAQNQSASEALDGLHSDALDFNLDSPTKTGKR
jgi:hypothetical protein